MGKTRRIAASAVVGVALVATTLTTPAGAQEQPAPEADVRERAEVVTEGLSTVTYEEGAAPSTQGGVDQRQGNSAALAAEEDACTYIGAMPVTAGDFRFSFGAGIDAADQEAIVFAAEEWSEELRVRSPIDVRVQLDGGEFPAGVLGGASPCAMYRFEGEDIWYPAAQVDQYDPDGANGPNEPEIGVVLSDAEDFYTGLDDAVPSDQISLATLALHELGHGLGFTSLAGNEGTSILLGGYPYIYDMFVGSEGRAVVGLSGTTLRNALTGRAGPLYWAGAEGVRVAGGGIPLYAPTTFSQGSSVGHVAASGQLMSPFIAGGDAILSVPRATQAMMADMGWILDDQMGNQAFVSALERDFLDRKISFNRLVARSEALGRGFVTRPQLIRDYATSDAWLGNIVDQLYRSTLGREADASGKAYWVGVLRSGQTPAQVGAYFYAGAEFYEQSGGTNTRWVKALYREILGRTGDASGVNYWAGLASSGTSRSSIAYTFYQSIESRRVRVIDLYRDLLQRNPDKSGREYWAGILENGRDVELAMFLAESTEYFKKAAQRF